MAKTFLILNWKMHPGNTKEAQALWGATKRALARARKTTAIVCAPFVYLQPLAKTRSTTALLGAQDVSVYEGGSHTGEISAQMLKEFRIRHVIVGHSERRELGETDGMIARKVKLALQSGLQPIVCIGERERSQHGEHLGELEDQMTRSLAGVGRAQAKQLFIAYEPLWAIGKSYKYAMQPHEIHETSIFIRKILTKMFGRAVASTIPVLYGGAVEEANIAQVVRQGDVSGVLVGRASLDGKSVSHMVKALEAKQ